MNELIHNHLYLIDARNSKAGIWDKESSTFYISREKFTSTFVAQEAHYDTGAPFGTATPIKDLGRAEVGVRQFCNNKFLKYLTEMKKEHTPTLISILKSTIDKAKRVQNKEIKE